MRSKVEAANYDLKQGLYDLSDKTRKFNDKTFEDKILCNIAALTNLGKNRTGFLFIGVTDKEEDTKRVEKLDKLKNVPRFQKLYLQPIITQYFIDNKSEIWSLPLIVHSKG